MVAHVYMATIAIAQGYPPKEAAAKMTLPNGFRAELVVSEPTIRQPVAIDFDDRGRLWVMQYLQYPNPAGLKRVQVDRFSRTAYDRVPEPPPKGPKGADRLTILVPNAQRPNQWIARDFVSGLNLASAFAFGHGGVFILQTPYLLFYPDRDRDDVPDADPEVLLTGFGMEDAHSVANSLAWGPDGWLYGCQGSTVTANIRGIEFQQGVWRYHPIRRRFELFCEGGGNSWGLDFDRRGHLLYSTNLGPNVLLHGVQGGYFWKSFGKHGALHNPYAYGYFDHVRHQNFRGGHVTVGGIVYRGDNFPGDFRHKYIGADLLGHAVYWHDLIEDGSTFRSKHAGELLIANDNWFAPSDVCQGPDGCVYVADWHDRRTAHPDPDAEWDRTNGRVFRIAHGSPGRPATFDLHAKSTVELLRLLSHRNHWYARRARDILAERRDPEAIFPLRTLLQQSGDFELALEALWALHVSGGAPEKYLRELLADPRPDVRRWAIRLLGDEDRIDSATAATLVELAARESDIAVRCQLAATAKRLSTNAAMAIVRGLLASDGSANDAHLPLMIWWAVERHCMADPQLAIRSVLGGIGNPRASPLRDFVTERLVRRFAVAQQPQASAALATILKQAMPDRSWLVRLLSPLEIGLSERRATSVNPDSNRELIQTFNGARESLPKDSKLLRVLARLGDRVALGELLGQCLRNDVRIEDRVAAIETLSEVAPSEIVDAMASLALANEPVEIRAAALAAWSRRGSDAHAKVLVANYVGMPARLRSQLRTVLLSRLAWARELVTAVEMKLVAAADFSTDEVAQLATHHDRELDARTRRLWGTFKGPTSEERLAEVRRLNNDVRAFAGNAAAGKPLFAKHCGLCHKLFGEGGAVGPDLTHANRADRQFLLVSIVDPSGAVRKEFMTHTAETVDGRVITGLIAEQSGAEVVFVNAKAERIRLRRDEITRLAESPTSTMPENIHKQLTPQELRDLFAYLQKP